MFQKQTGMTFISLLVVLALIVFFTLLTLKIAPIYMDHFKVQDSLESLADEAGLVQNSNAKITSLLMSRLNINMVDSVTKDDIVITRDSRGVTINVNYEVIKNIVGNLDVLVYFDETVEVSH